MVYDFISPISFLVVLAHLFHSVIEVIETCIYGTLFLLCTYGYMIYVPSILMSDMVYIYVYYLECKKTIVTLDYKFFHIVFFLHVIQGNGKCWSCSNSVHPLSNFIFLHDQAASFPIYLRLESLSNSMMICSIIFFPFIYVSSVSKVLDDVTEGNYVTYISHSLVLLTIEFIPLLCICPSSPEW